MLGAFDGERVEIRELHRFLNEPVRAGGALYLGRAAAVLRDEACAQQGRARRGCRSTPSASTPGAWTLACIDKNGHLLGLPVHYRDQRTDGMMEKGLRGHAQGGALPAHGHRALRSINTLYQLYAMKLEGDPTLEAAQRAAVHARPAGLSAHRQDGRGVHHRLHLAAARSLQDATGTSACIDTLRPAPRACFAAHPDAGHGARHAAACDRQRVRRFRDAPSSPSPRTTPPAAVAAVPPWPTRTLPTSARGTWSLLGAEVSTPLCEPRR